MIRLYSAPKRESGPDREARSNPSEARLRNYGPVWVNQ